MRAGATHRCHRLRHALRNASWFSRDCAWADMNRPTRHVAHLRYNRHCVLLIALRGGGLQVDDCDRNHVPDRRKTTDRRARANSGAAAALRAGRGVLLWALVSMAGRGDASCAHCPLSTAFAFCMGTSAPVGLPLTAGSVCLAVLIGFYRLGRVGPLPSALGSPWAPRRLA